MTCFRLPCAKSITDHVEEENDMFQRGSGRVCLQNDHMIRRKLFLFIHVYGYSVKSVGLVSQSKNDRHNKKKEICRILSLIFFLICPF